MSRTFLLVAGLLLAMPAGANSGSLASSPFEGSGAGPDPMARESNDGEPRTRDGGLGGAPEQQDGADEGGAPLRRQQPVEYSEEPLRGAPVRCPSPPPGPAPSP